LKPVSTYIKQETVYFSKKTKAHKIVKGSKITNICYMVVIKKLDILSYEIKDGAFEGACFIEFIENNLVPHF